MKWNDLAKPLGLTAAFAMALLVAGAAEAREAVSRDAQAQPVVAATADVAPVAVADASEPVAEAASGCDDTAFSSETSAVADGIAVLTGEAATQAAACKPCKGRTWCTCTYNGMQRASCDPCCYRNNIGVLTCLD